MRGAAIQGDATVIEVDGSNVSQVVLQYAGQVRFDLSSLTKDGGNSGTRGKKAVLTLDLQ